MATRKDVAKTAGVSEATVSYVLNDTKPVTPEVRQRVLDAVAKLGYRPNLVARSLASNHTRHVALLMENLHNPYFLEILDGAQAVAVREGYFISTLATAGNDMELVTQMIGRGVEGAILTVHDGKIEHTMQKNVHCVVDGWAVVNDYRPAVFSMVDHLVSLGHSQIAFLAGIPLEAGHTRYIYLKEALGKKGLSLDERLVVKCGDNLRTDEQAGYEATLELISRRVPFTAVFAVNDLMAVGANRALWEAGLRVPEDVSLVGCDNIPASRWNTPSLSTFAVHGDRIGAGLMETLIDTIEKRPVIRRVVEAEYISRESVSERKRP